MKKTTIYQPKTKRLSGIVIELDEVTQFGDKFESNIDGCEDWHLTFEEAKKEVLSHLQYIYSGKAAEDRMADIAYARQEQIACGNTGW